MRASIIGCFFYNDRAKREALVKVSPLLTHRDPRALIGAQAIALAASLQRHDIKSITPFSKLPNEQEYEKEWKAILEKIIQSLAEEDSVTQFLEKMDIREGPSGYVFQSVPAVLYVWLGYEVYEDSVLLFGGILIPSPSGGGLGWGTSF